VLTAIWSVSLLVVGLDWIGLFAILRANSTHSVNFKKVAQVHGLNPGEPADVAGLEGGLSAVFVESTELVESSEAGALERQKQYRAGALEASS
jgi:hypothetical protein